MKILLNVIRGALIGLAELVPGVSGGTIALVTGVYERILAQANEFIDAVKTLPKNRAESLRRLKNLEWTLLLPLLVGMFTIVVTAAGVMKNFVTDHPEAARGLFFGLVLVSLIVPLRMIDWDHIRRRAPLAAVAFVAVAAATFFATGITSTQQSNPSLIVVFFAAAIAICALVLPGVSGSFFLLTMGLYAATLDAVHDRNLTYIAVFGLGALLGIVSFVRVLGYLLAKHHAMTLLVMSGLMLGSLRALWPWQGETGNLLAPQGNILVPVALAVAGAIAVGAMILIEDRFAAAEK